MIAAKGDGDGHVKCAQGHTHWGRFGAAGMLLDHTDSNTGVRRYLLQHRSPWVMEGGTWGIPGGAMDSHETPEVAALRELSEEVGQPPGLSNVRHLHTNDHGNGWAYHTIGATVPDGPEGPWEPSSGDANGEGVETGWFTPAEVSELPLHPGFASSWDQLQKEPTTGHHLVTAELQNAHEAGSIAPANASPSIPGPAELSSGGRVLDHLSLSSVAHNLHYRFQEQGLDPAAAKDYAGRLLGAIGYPDDAITVLAAIQAWQQLYPGDDPLAATNQIPVATVPQASLGYGTTSKDQSWQAPSRSSQTQPRSNESSTDGNSSTAPIPLLYMTRVAGNQRLTYTIDPELLDPYLFGPDGTYHGQLPPGAVLDVNHSTVPSEVNNPDDHWPDWGEQPEDARHHYDPQISGPSWP